MKRHGLRSVQIEKKRNAGALLGVNTEQYMKSISMQVGVIVALTAHCYWEFSSKFDF
jgi:hypothetical protein